MSQGSTQAAQAAIGDSPSQTIGRYRRSHVARAHNHYFRPCPYDSIDVYRVLEIFNVTDPCLQHAVKKLLVAGSRGHKDIHRDIQDSVDTLVRWQEMRNEEQLCQDEGCLHYGTRNACISPSDIRTDTYVSQGSLLSGFGTRVESGVRVTHVPSGKFGECDTERSAYANKHKAMESLMAQFAGPSRDSLQP
jgi:hypothetical protein